MNNNKQRIFIVSPTESLLTMRGNRHPTLADMLVSNGQAVTYITTDFSHWNKQLFHDDQLMHLQERVNYEMVIIKTPGYSKNIGVERILWNMRVALSAGRVLLRSMSRSDILLVPSRPPELLAIGSILKKVKHCRIVCDIRDVWPDGLPLGRDFKSRLFSHYCDLLNRLSIGAFDQFVHTAPGFLGWLQRYDSRCRSEFIPLGFDTDRWISSRPIVSDEDSNIIRFVYLGDVTDSMDLQPLLLGLAKDRRFRLSFIGGGDKLGELIEQVRVMEADNVEFCGYLTKNEVIERLKDFHVAVIPMKSRYVMPNKLFDFIAAYRPVLAFGENDTSDLVERHSIGWKLLFEEVAVRKFLNEITLEEIVEKSRNIESMRDEFSRDFLYEKFISLVTNGAVTRN